MYTKRIQDELGICKEKYSEYIFREDGLAINPYKGCEILFLPEDMESDIKVEIEDFLAQLGDIITVKEDQLSIVGTIAGCGPAFVDVFLDALGDAGVLNGLSRSVANKLAASMVKGSSSLAYDSPLAPAQLRDQVCSPGGTTIKGVVDLEKNGFRYSIISAINKANEN